MDCKRLRQTELVCLFMVLPVAASGQAELQRAAQHLDSGAPALALSSAKTHIEKHGPNPEAFMLIGAALSQMGKPRESNQYLEKALAIKPDMPLALRLLGVNAFDAGDFSTARSRFRALLKLAGEDDEAHVYLAQIALQLREFSRAVTEFRAAPTLLSTDPHLQILMARALISSGQKQEGKQTLLKTRPQDPLLTFEAGRLLLECGEEQAAIERFLAIRENYPEPLVLEYNLALAHFRLSKLDAAAEILEKLVNDRRADADGFRLLADVYRRQEKAAEAFDLLQRASAAFPENAQIMVDLLTMCVERVAIEQGLSIATAALQRHAGSAEIYGQRAQLHALQGEQKRAQSDYRTAISLSPGTEWLHLGLGLSLLLDDRLAEARQVLEKRLRKTSGYYLLYLYSEVLVRQSADGDDPLRLRAIEMLERTVVLNPTFAPARLSLARLRADDGSWQKAAVHYRAAIAPEPDDKRAYYQLARLLQQNGKPEEAGELLDQLRRLSREEKALTVEQAAVQRLRSIQQSAARDRSRDRGK